MALAIINNHVHVWYVNWREHVAEYDQLLGLLNQTEQEKAFCYVQEKDKSCSVVGRAILRQLLGLYLKCSPCDVNFQYNAYEKPGLAAPHADRYYFNLSHSYDWIIYAISAKSPVGIDIEYVDHDVDIQGIAARFFHPEENAFIQSLTGRAQLAAFFRCWARKEALLKALGEGLFYPLAQCQVSLALDAPARVLQMHGHDAATWHLADLDIAPNFAAALAVQGECDHVELYSWQKSGN